MKKWDVRLFYTGYVTRQVRAESEEEAIQKARKMQDKAYFKEKDFYDAHLELLDTIMPWEDADEAEEAEGGPK